MPSIARLDSLINRARYRGRARYRSLIVTVRTACDERVGGDAKFQAKKIGVLPPEIISRYSGLQVLRRLANGELPLRQ